MYIVRNRFIFLHLPKTGGHFIRKTLQTVYRGSVLRRAYHISISEIPEQYRHLPKMGFIRNPWDWYVSWYSYGQKICEKHPDGYDSIFHTVSNNNTADFKTTITNLLTLQSNTTQADKIEQEITARNNESKEKRTHRVFMMMNRAIQPTFINDMKDNNCGYLTNQYLTTFYGSPQVEWSNNVTIGKVETLREDFFGFIKQHDSHPRRKAEKMITNMKKHNTTDHKPYVEYYDDELKELVGEKEKLIINRYGFTFGS